MITCDLLNARNLIQIKAQIMDKKKETARIILRSHRIGRIANIIAEKLSVSPVEALRRFYRSDTCREFHDRSSGLYLQGDLYIVNDYLQEIKS